MPDLIPKNRLRPSLLDRLTDRQPDQRLESIQAQTVDEAELRELVRRDLTWLFNTTHMAADMEFEAFPRVKSSVLNFGVVDLTGRMLSSIRLEELEQSVREALLHYEPRLLPDSIAVDARVGNNRFGMSALIIDIRAELWAEPLPLELQLRTEVDLETGRVNVDEARPEP